MSAGNQRELPEILCAAGLIGTGDFGARDDCLQYAGVTGVVGWEEPSQIDRQIGHVAAPAREMVDGYMQWEYKLVALGLLVDATEQHQREKHEQILNDLGREEWEAVAYAAQSDTVLLKRPAKHAADRKTIRDYG